MIKSRVMLRISGKFKPDKITNLLNLSPSHTHRKGEGVMSGSIPPYYCDMWTLESPLAESESVESHLVWVSNQLKGKNDVLQNIKNYASIDIFCGLTSIDMNSFLLSPQALSIFHELQIGLEVSLILFDDDSEEVDEKQE